MCDPYLLGLKTGMDFKARYENGRLEKDTSSGPFWRHPPPPQKKNITKSNPRELQVSKFFGERERFQKAILNDIFMTLRQLSARTVHGLYTGCPKSSFL